MKTTNLHRYPVLLKKTIQRMESSETQQKRKNARKALRLLLKKILKECNQEYPLIDKHGRESKAIRKPVCPVCGIPTKDFSYLAEHLILNHFPKSNGMIKCYCGKTFTSTTDHHARFAFCPLFVRHLAGIKDLKAHVVLGTLSGL